MDASQTTVTKLDVKYNIRTYKKKLLMSTRLKSIVEALRGQ